MKHLSPLLCTLLFSALILSIPVTGAAANNDIAPGDDMATVLNRLAAFHRYRLANPNPPNEEDPQETPKAAPQLPGVDAVYSRGGVNIHYRSDYTTNRAYIQKL